MDEVIDKFAGTVTEFPPLVWVVKKTIRCLLDIKNPYAAALVDHITAARAMQETARITRRIGVQYVR